MFLRWRKEKAAVLYSILHLTGNQCSSKEREEECCITSGFKKKKESVLQSHSDFAEGGRLASTE